MSKEPEEYKAKNDDRLKRHAKKKFAPVGSGSAQVKRLQVNKYYEGELKAVKRRRARKLKERQRKDRI